MIRIAVRHWVHQVKRYSKLLWKSEDKDLEGMGVGWGGGWGARGGKREGSVFGKST